MIYPELNNYPRPADHKTAVRLEGGAIRDLYSELGGDWTVVSDQYLEKIFHFHDFNSALDYVHVMKNVFDDMNHHPELTIGWGKLTVKLSTHQVHGLTPKDFQLARRFDELYAHVRN